MNATLRWVLTLSYVCCLGISVGCGSTASSVSTPSPISPSGPVSVNRSKFAYTSNQGGSLSGYSVDLSTGALKPLSGFPLSVRGNPYLITHDKQNRFVIVDDNAVFMLHVYAIDPTTGALNEVAPSPYSTMIQPGEMVVDPSGTHLYLYRTGASAAFPGVSGNQMVTYNLSSTGILSMPVATPLPSGPQSSPFLPSTGIAINNAGTFLYLQDLFTIHTFSIDATSGALSLRQSLPLPTQFGDGLALDPAGHFLYAADRASIRSYGIDPVSGLLSLTKSTPQAEGGAYTLSVSPNGLFAYTIENNNDLVSYAVSEGSFTPVGSSHSGVYGLRIAVDPSGSFVYVPQGCSNCPSGTYNVVHQFSISQTGALTPLSPPAVAAGTTPFDITVTSQ